MWKLKGGLGGKTLIVHEPPYVKLIRENKTVWKIERENKITWKKWKQENKTTCSVFEQFVKQRKHVRKSGDMHYEKKFLKKSPDLWNITWERERV